MLAKRPSNGWEKPIMRFPNDVDEQFGRLSRTSCQADEVLAVLMASATSKPQYIVFRINNTKSDRRQRLTSV
jgi:hypothetical protein